MKNDIFLLQLSVSQYFVEINEENRVIVSDSILRATIFDNIYTGNSFKNLLLKHYEKDFNLIKI